MIIVPFILYFLIYSFLGWAIEVGYASLKARHWVPRRGIYTQFFLPLYGTCGVLIVRIAQVIGSPLVASILGALVVTFLEYMTGWWIDTKFHTKFWDYSAAKGNIKGYVCLPFTVIWVILAYSLIRIIHPFVATWIMYNSFAAQCLILGMMGTVFMLDVVMTYRLHPLQAPQKI